MQKAPSNDFSESVTHRGQRTGEQENRESCSSESAPTVRTRTMSSGHGCTEGKDYSMFHTITQGVYLADSAICLENFYFGPLVKSRRYFFKLPRRMPHRTIFAESVQKGRSNDFSLSVTDRGRQGTGDDRGTGKSRIVQ